MGKLILKSNFKPTFDQKKAVEVLVDAYLKGLKYQVLLGVTGSGKTFTIANVIEKLQKPALIISHNKTLAAQLFQEFRDFFPEAGVSFFVSYYDYYQPEAYIPSTDTYIEKDADINELIDKLRLQATTNILSRKDTIVVASVSCIYNLGSPKEFRRFVFEISEGLRIQRNEFIKRLTELQYTRSEFGFHRSTFRVLGDTIDVFPTYQNEGLRIILEQDLVKKIEIFDPLTGNLVEDKNLNIKSYHLFPAKHFITDPLVHEDTFELIRKDMEEEVKRFLKQGKILEANRLKTRVEYDIEMIKEVGYVKGIENYSRYFDKRKPGEPPFTLLDYFKESYKDNWLVFVDESHITFPQIRGMYNGDISRKKTLVDYGFRLAASFDNRPLTFPEFMSRIPNFIATSATPSEREINLAKDAIKFLKKRNPSLKIKNKTGVVEQLLRPTGIPDPKIEVKPTKSEVEDVIKEIKKTISKKQRVLVTTLTKKTAEDLTYFLQEKGIKVHFLHSDIATLERTDILEDLRRGKYDVIIGVNLLREGLDLPEVSLVCILDADKEGFLRSEVSLIQTMGRAARHVDGRVILYADNITNSIKKAITEVERRRNYQIMMNKKYKIKPRSIQKPIREKLIELEEESFLQKIFGEKGKASTFLPDIKPDELTAIDKKRLIIKLKKEMKIAANDLNFELAAEIRDKIFEISSSL